MTRNKVTEEHKAAMRRRWANRSMHRRKRSVKRCEVGELNGDVHRAAARSLRTMESVLCAS